ncbi:hypothetical protein O3P69_020862 [Scylla paramamosain]|uniref:Uncharacterized protein n=1 Tax=Scylla paramamosain TaxID=85552 RepID=A0AAW0TNW0_SCYPA
MLISEGGQCRAAQRQGGWRVESSVGRGQPDHLPLSCWVIRVRRNSRLWPIPERNGNRVVGPGGETKPRLPLSSRTET